MVVQVGGGGLQVKRYYMTSYFLVTTAMLIAPFYYRLYECRTIYDGITYVVTKVNLDVQVRMRLGFLFESQYFSDN